MRAGSLVLVASNDVSLRRWWKQGLGRHFALEEVETVRGMKAAVAEMKPSVVLLDTTLPRLSGIKGVANVSRLSPITKIVVLADDQNHSEAVAALKAGAHGYCNRYLESSLIRKIVETVQKGELWVRRAVMLALLRELMPLRRRSADAAEGEPDMRLRPLTDREREVARLVAAGARNKDIASSLNITETTVKAHLTAIFRKLGIPDRLRLALMLTASTAPGATDVRGEDF